MAAPILDDGPTVVYTPGPGRQHLVDIIFVHGLFGHPKNTWTARTPRDTGKKSGTDQSIDPPRKKWKIGSQERFDETFWPRDLLPTIIPTARVITWGYKTTKATVFRHAETFLQDLAMLRPSHTAVPIIFVAHSLGGIVVKDALSLSKQVTTHLKDILLATIGVAFLGTPHRGSKTASLGKIVFELSRLLLQNRNIKILRALEGDSEVLDRISNSFAQILASNENIKVHSFQENSDTKEYQSETRSGLNADHRNMAKYASAEDINFQRVSSVLLRWVEPLSVPENYPNQLSPLYDDSTEGPADISDGEHERLLEALNFPDARSRLENVEEAYTDTYTWIYEDGLGFKAWLQGQDPRPIFWISGKPGSGKSTLMKYALAQGTTRLRLEEHSQTRWILTGFFFHDRGGELQKTMEGFLRVILYQMLVQRRDLFLLVYHILRDWCEQKDLQGPAFRDIENLQNALFAIARNANSPLNCCIFVDALDEHLGNHRELIPFLKNLAHQDWAPSFRLRLCLASRRENIFADALHDCPGFAVHQYTRADIRRYAAGRFQDEQSVNLDEQQKEITGRLVSQIEAKSDGVFMWVRLVVNELVEGLCEGDTPGELEALLSGIPTELSNLYARAVRRHPRRSTTSIARHRNEAYVMFSMASNAIDPIPWRHFIRATLFLAGQKHSGAEVDEMSQESMRRRLNSRTCGLLEVVEQEASEESNSDEGPYEGCVQFIHQTVKEFMHSGEGVGIIKEGISLADESGDEFIFRYILERLKSSCQWAIKCFFDYATRFDLPESPAASWIQPSMNEIPKSALISIIQHFTYGAKNRPESIWGNAYLLTRSNFALWLIIYTLLNLVDSLRMSLETRPEVIDAELSVLLLEAGLITFGSISCFSTLLEAGVASHLTAETFNGVDELLPLSKSGSAKTAMDFKNSAVPHRFRSRRHP